MLLPRNGIVLVLLVCVAGACGGAKIYTPPEGDDTASLVLVNNIFKAGFYVEIDGADAGFLTNERRIPLKAGSHTIKIHNSETTVAEEAYTTKHKFTVRVKVDKGETKTVELAWDDPGYQKDVSNVMKSIRPEAEEKKKKETRSHFPGM